MAGSKRKITKNGAIFWCRGRKKKRGKGEKRKKEKKEKGRKKRGKEKKEGEGKGEKGGAKEREKDFFKKTEKKRIFVPATGYPLTHPPAERATAMALANKRCCLI